MIEDHHTDRDARQPCDIPAKELDSEINAAMQKLWILGFFEQVGGPAIIKQAMDARKARLSVLLSRQADIQSKRIVRLTWGLMVLTIGLLIATGILLFVALKTDEHIKELIHGTEIAGHHDEQQQPPAPQ